MPAESIKRWLGIAKVIQSQINKFGLGSLNGADRTVGYARQSLINRFDDIVTNSNLSVTSRQLFIDEHYAQAVEAALKFVDRAVRQKSGLSRLHGDKLMRTAFSPNEPKLRFNELKTTSQKDEQRGYMELFAGAMTGIRNPRAHEPDLYDSAGTALEMLALANHLMTKLNSTETVNKSGTSP